MNLSIQLKGADKIAFAKLLKKDPCHQCSTKCPFDAVVKYLHKCPTCESAAAAAATKDTLSFMQALSSRGGEHRVLTVNKLGLNQAKKSIENVSALLIYNAAIILIIIHYNHY